jgi:hypothetical protein
MQSLIVRDLEEHLLSRFRANYPKAKEHRGFLEEPYSEEHQWFMEDGQMRFLTKDQDVAKYFGSKYSANIEVLVRVHVRVHVTTYAGGIDEYNAEIVRVNPWRFSYQELKRRLIGGFWVWLRCEYLDRPSNDPVLPDAIFYEVSAA